MAYEPTWITLPGVVNMRDLGGQPVASGGRIRANTYLRSDNLQDLSPDSVRRLVDELGVTDIVDLRTNVERVSTGPGPLADEPGLSFHELTMYPEESDETGIPDDEDDSNDPVFPWQGTWHDASRAENGHEEHLARHYLGYLDRRPDNVIRALRAIAAADGAVVVHCAAGKDRTGTITALALSAVGVPREVVVADYDATNQVIEKIFERLSTSRTYAADLAGQTIKDQTTPAETMEMLLDAVDQTYGGVDGWLRAHGWTDADQEALVTKLVDRASIDSESVDSAAADKA